MKYVFVTIIIVLLSACQTGNISRSSNDHGNHNLSKSNKIEKDGAPAGPLPTKFKDQKPVYEPMSRYGNPDVYKVEGKTYKVLTSSSKYRARGLASWYGTKFHAKRTSSGEHYDMYALTAAHKTLPLPTYVRVKNLNNGRVAIVKVNDRGPFHSNRIIDLSYGAAVKLGLLPKGTAFVEIEALSVVAKGQEHVAQYYIQAGAFSSQKLAEALKKKLVKLSSAKVNIEKYKGRYIVKTGPFASKRTVDNLKITLARNGVKGAFIVLR